MANLYGVANCALYPFYTNTIGAGNVTCNPGVETNIADSGLIVAPSNGYFMPVFLGNIAILSGATVPTSMLFGARIGAGSDTANQNIPTNLFVSSNYTFVFVWMTGPASQTAWQPPGSHFFLTLTAQGQAVTVSQGFSVPYFWLIRSADQ